MAPSGSTPVSADLPAPLTRAGRRGTSTRAGRRATSTDVDARTTALHWLTHPVTLLAMVVLGLNDHVLKDRFPGVITGKLSDLAGLVLAPALLATVTALVTPHRTARTTSAVGIDRPVLMPVVVTAVGFVLVKAFPGGASAASWLWSLVAGPSMIRADVTDLVALPALALALRVGLGAPHRWSRTGALIAVLPLATLAVAATSAPDYPDAVTVHRSGAVIVAGQGNAYDKDRREPSTWSVTADGGQTWRRTTPDDHPRNADATPTHACAPEEPGRCYRIVPGHLRVEESLNGGASWWVAWTVTDEQRQRLARHYDDVGDLAEYLSSRALAVAAVDGGHAVVVANGRDGYAVRDPTGRWTRIGFGTTVHPGGGRSTDPAPALEERSARDAAPEIIAAALAGLLAVTVAGGIAGWRRRRWPAGLALVLLVVGALVALSGGVGLRNSNGMFPIFLTVLGSLFALVGAFGVLVMAVVSGALHWRPALLAALIGIASGGAGVAVFSAWGNGAVGYRVAGLTTVAWAMAGLTAAVAVVANRRFRADQSR